MTQEKLREFDFDMISTIIIHNSELYNKYSLIENEILRKKAVGKIFKSIEYLLFKLPLCDSKALWTGKISEKALTELTSKDRPKVEREHFWARKIVINKLFNEWLPILVENKGEGLKKLYLDSPGFGLYHITTSSENGILNSNYQNPLEFKSPEQSYNNADIELVDAPKDLFGKSRDGMAWWKSVNTKYLNI